MSKQQLTSEPLDEESVADLDKLAAEWGCTREHLVATAVLRFLGEKTRHWPTEFDELPPFEETDPLAIALNEAEEKARDAMRAFLKVGEDAIARGDTISHEDLMAELRGLDERAEARKNAA